MGTGKAPAIKDIAKASPAEDADSGIADPRHHLTMLPSMIAVFVLTHTAHPMQPVFDHPMPHTRCSSSSGPLRSLVHVIERKV